VLPATGEEPLSDLDPSRGEPSASPEGLRGLEVDDEVEPIELLNWQISGVAVLRILAT